jgi:hypothetical protein
MDKLLKNHDCRGSRHNGGHKPLPPLILLMFLRHNIPCAMVLRFPPRSSRRPGFVENCEPFYVEFRGENAHPCGVPAGPRHTLCEPSTDHIVGHTDDRYRLSRVLRSSDERVAEGKNDINILPDELVCQRRCAIVAALRKSGQETDIA